MYRKYTKCEQQNSPPQTMKMIEDADDESADMNITFANQYGMAVRSKIEGCG